MSEYKNVLLPNKIPLIIVPIKNAKTSTILLIVKTGSRYENRLNSGISHFLEHLFFKGTKKRPNALALASELDSLGGEYNAFTAKEYTGYWVKAATTKTVQALDLVSDMLLNSKFAAAEIEKEKGVIIEELNMYEDNPLMHIEDVFETCLYGDTPAGRETIGTKKNILNFKRADFIDYFSKQYGVNSMKLVLAGGFGNKDILAAKKLFTAFTDNSWQEKEAAPTTQKKPQIKTVIKATDQLTMSLGVRSYPVGHPAEFAVKLLSIILGGSMSSRLFTSLRGKRGLAYYVRTATETYSDTGYLTTQAGVPAAAAAPAIKIIMAEYRKLTINLVGATELRRAQDLLAGKMLLEMEATDNLAVWYARQAVLRNKILTPTDFIKKIKKISALELRQTARDIFKNKGLNLATIGPVKGDALLNILKF